MKMDAFVVERALTLVDPVGLIAFGCPYDEYVHEAKEIAERIETVQSRKDRRHFRSIARKIFNEAFGKLGRLDDDCVDRILETMRDGENPRNAFVPGATYRVVLPVAFAEDLLNDTVVCLQRWCSSRDVDVVLLAETTIKKFPLTIDDESRLLWRMREVK